MKRQAFFWRKTHSDHARSASPPFPLCVVVPRAPRQSATIEVMFSLAAHETDGTFLAKALS